MIALYAILNKEVALKQPLELKYLQREGGITFNFLSIKGNSLKLESVDHLLSTYRKLFLIVSMDGVFTMDKLDIIATQPDRNMVLNSNREILSVWL